LNTTPPSVDIGPVRIYFGEKNGKYPDGNQVIVQGAERRAVFDSPLVASRIGEAFDQADLIIQGHVHEDHATGVYRLPDTPIYVHNADLQAMQSWEGLGAAYGYTEDTFSELREEIAKKFQFTPRPDAIGYEHDTVWDLGGDVLVRAIHTPGHTAGHCVLLVEPVGVAFIGDIDLSGFGPYYGDRSSNLGDFRRTLELLPDIPATTWVTYHHRGIYTERDSFLRDLAEFAGKFDQREQQLLDRLREWPRTLEELVGLGLLYEPDSPVLWAREAERRTISQHLEELASAGRVELDSRGRYRTRG